MFDVIPAKAGIQKKKYKYNKFLKLKARFISLYAGLYLEASIEKSIEYKIRSDTV
ncbi:MAG: hypothetical protein ACEY3D_05425 [Rickettsia sp.]|uniref:hypothetical protein n=1 Tax=Rickettsia sp. TaxID=789 RepID=UPI00397D2FEA